MKKTETIAEFLARGGTIQRLSAVEPTIKQEGIKINSGGPVVILTSDEASLYYGEQKIKKPSKKKAAPKIDMSALPEALRKKYIEGLIDANSEEDEDDFE